MYVGEISNKHLDDCICLLTEIVLNPDASNNASNIKKCVAYSETVLNASREIWISDRGGYDNASTEIKEMRSKLKHLINMAQFLVAN